MQINLFASLSICLFVVLSPKIALSQSQDLDYGKALEIFKRDDSSYLDYKGKTEKVRHDLASLIQKRDELLKQKQNLEYTANQIDAEIAATKRSSDNADIQINDLNAQKSNLLNNIRSLDARIAETQRDITTKNGEIERLRQQVLPLLNQKDDKERELNAQGAKINQNAIDLQYKNGQIAQKNQDKARAENQLQTLQTELNNNNNKIETLTREANDKNAQLLSAQNGIEEQNRKQERLQTEKSEIERQMRESRARIDNLREQSAPVEREIQKLKDQKQPLFDKKARTEEQIRSTNAEIASIQSQIDATNQQINANVREQERLRQQIETLKRELESKQNDFNATNQKIQSLSERQRNLENQRNETQREIETLQTELKRLQSDLAQTLRELNNINNQCIQITRNLGIRMPIDPIIEPCDPKNPDGICLIENLDDAFLITDNASVVLSKNPPTSPIDLPGPPVPPKSLINNMCQISVRLVSQEIQKIENLKNPSDEDLAKLEAMKTALPQLETLNSQATPLVTQAKDTQKTIVAKKNEIKEKNKSLEQIEKDLGKILSEIENQQNLANNILGEIDRLNQQINTTIPQQISQIDQTIAGLRNQLNAQIEQKNQRENQLSRLNEELTRIKGEIASLDTQIAQLDASIAQITSQIKNEEQNFSTLNSRHIAVGSDIQECLRLKGDLQNLIAKLQTSLANINNEKQNLSARNTTISNSEIPRATNAISSINNDLSTLNFELTSLELDKKFLQQQLEILKREYAFIDQQLAQYYAQISPIEARIAELNNDLNRFVNEKDQTYQKITNADRELANLAQFKNDNIIKINNLIQSKKQKDQEIQNILATITVEIDPQIRSAQITLNSMETQLNTLLAIRNASEKNYLKIRANFDNAKSAALTEVTRLSKPLGEKEGLERGPNDGLKKGTEDGENHGILMGNTIALNKAFHKGYSQGKEQGILLGTSEGEESLVNNLGSIAELEGHFDGFNNGYREAYEKALKESLIDLKKPLSDDPEKDGQNIAAAYARAKAKIELKTEQTREFFASLLKEEDELTLTLSENGSLSFNPEPYSPNKDHYPLPNVKANPNPILPEAQFTYVIRSWTANHPEIVSAALAKAKEVYLASFRAAYSEQFAKAYLSVYQAQYDAAVRAESSKEQKTGFDEGYQLAYDASYKSSFNDSFIKAIDESDFKNLFKQNVTSSSEEGSTIGSEDGFLMAYYTKLAATSKTSYAQKVIASYQKNAAALLNEEKKAESARLAAYYHSKLKHEYALYVEEVAPITKPIKMDQSADFTVTLRNLSLRGVNKGKLQMQVAQENPSEITLDLFPPKSKLVVKKAVVEGFKNEENKVSSRFLDSANTILVEKTINVAAIDPQPAEQCKSAGYTTCKGKSGSRFKVCRAKSQTITLCDVCVDGKQGFVSVPVDSRGYYHDLAIGCDRDPQTPAELMVPENIKFKALK